MYRRLETLCQAWLAPKHVGITALRFAMFLAISVAVIGGVWLLGPYPITLFPQDTAYALIQGDYLLEGYRPYVDYYSLHGPFPFIFSALAMKVYGISLQSILLSQVLGAIFFGLLGFKILGSRLHWGMAIFLAVMIEVLLLSSTPTGFKAWREFSWAMWYNTVCYCIQSLVFVYLLVPSRSDRWVSRAADCLIIAFGLAAMYGSKPNYLAFSVLPLLFGGVLFPRCKGQRVHTVVVILLAVVFVFIIFGAIGGSAGGYFEYLRSVPTRINPLLLSLRFVQYTRTIGLFLLGCLVIGWMASVGGVLKQSWREWILSLLMFAAMLLSASLSAQDQEVVPMLGVIILGLAMAIVSRLADRRRTIDWRLASIAACISLLLLVHAPKNAMLSWVFSHRKVQQLSEAVPHFSVAEIERMGLPLDPRVDLRLLGMMPQAWTQKQVDALVLLRDAKVPSGEKLFVATLTSAIPLLTEQTYAQGQATWWPFAFVPAPQSVPLLDEDLLEDADWVLRDLKDPRPWGYLTHWRGEYFEGHFERKSENDEWALYGRKKMESETDTAASGP